MSTILPRKEESLITFPLGENKLISGAMVLAGTLGSGER
jgi:hypothetical protein